MEIGKGRGERRGDTYRRHDDTILNICKETQSHNTEQTGQVKGVLMRRRRRGRRGFEGRGGRGFCEAEVGLDPVGGGRRGGGGRDGIV